LPVTKGHAGIYGARRRSGFRRGPRALQNRERERVGVCCEVTPVLWN